MSGYADLIYEVERRGLFASSYHLFTRCTTRDGTEEGVTQTSQLTPCSGSL
jgi:hypothetical protein